MILEYTDSTRAILADGMLKGKGIRSVFCPNQVVDVSRLATVPSGIVHRIEISDQDAARAQDVLAVISLLP